MVSEIIHIQYHVATCCICGKDDASRWGVPIATDTALIVSNDYAGEYTSKPACRVCWQKHGEGKFVGHDTTF